MDPGRVLYEKLRKADKHLSKTTRIDEGDVEEVVLAINPTIEGDATVLYLSNLLAKRSIRVTKLAHGLPMGADIDYADDLTLQKAFLGRNAVVS